MKLKHLPSAFGVVILIAILHALPLSVVRWAGKSLGSLASSLLRRRRFVAEDNLRRAFPDYSAETIRTLARESFRSVAISFFELLYLPRLSPKRLKKELTILNLDTVRSEFALQRGAVVVIAHFANWEFAAQGIGLHLGRRITAIYKPQSNPYVDSLIAWFRRKFGNAIVPMGHAPREVLKALDNGEIVVLAADQTAAKESIWVPFFGRPIPTYKGPALFALKTNSQLFVFLPHRTPSGRYEGEIVPIPASDLHGTVDEKVFELTKRHTETTERFIRENPGQWMWTHRRWKHEEHAAESEPAGHANN